MEYKKDTVYFDDGKFIKNKDLNRRANKNAQIFEIENR
jgi:hypothetical protein